MRFKLDENLGRGTLAAFEAAGHDVSSIHLQSLDGATDDQVFEVCRTEVASSSPVTSTSPTRSCMIPALHLGLRCSDSPTAPAGLMSSRLSPAC